MSFKVTKYLPTEIVYGYAMLQRYNHLNPTARTNANTPRVLAVLPQDVLDEYAKTFTTLYQAKYHEQMLVDGDELNFNNVDANKDKKYSRKLDKMFWYDNKNKLLNATSHFNPSVVIQNFAKFLSKEELDILNKEVCYNIATRQSKKLSIADRKLIEEYKQELLDNKTDIPTLKCEYDNKVKSDRDELFVMLLGTAYRKNLKISKENIAKLSESMVILSEIMPQLTEKIKTLPYKTGNQTQAFTQLIYDNGEENKNVMRTLIADEFNKHCIDYNRNDVDKTLEGLIDIYPTQIVLCSQKKLDKYKKNILKREALSQLEPIKPQPKQIGDKTPPEKVIEKYKRMEKNLKIQNRIYGKGKTRPIHAYDTMNYIKAKNKLKEKNQTKDGR